jgi:stage IV sporulation protein B
VPCESGQFVGAEIVGIEKSSKEVTGELQGVFSGGTKAEIVCNDQTGVFAYANSPVSSENVVNIALKQEIKQGKAQILTTVDGKGPQYYDCIIKKVYHNDSSKIKNMIIEVTDPELLQKTGGIVQGMSGSPIIQNGKLIGAVTHVFVNDPTKGYGIFAENMLETAQGVGQGLAPAEKIKDAS